MPDAQVEKGESPCLPAIFFRKREGPMPEPLIDKSGYGLNVPPSPKFICWGPNSSEIVLGSGVFGR